MKKLTVAFGDRSYAITIGRGEMKKAKEYFNLSRRVMILTDEGVPGEYVETLRNQCDSSCLIKIEQGEQSKGFATYERILAYMLEKGFTREDCVVSLGGGVVGDLGGFVAATYMRGIDFYAIPTTTLSQIDSSIGGKVAINLAGHKNMVGSFYQPQGVIIDSDTLKTLPKRHFYNGLVEALKAGIIYDETLFSLFETGDMEKDLDEIIYRSLVVKKEVVEKDERELSLRKILNFGHTLGHGVESYYGLGELLHGECVAIGMLPMIEDKQLQERTIKILRKMNLRTKVPLDMEKVYQLMQKDKKASGGGVTVVTAPKLGESHQKRIPVEELRTYLGEVQE